MRCHADDSEAGAVDGVINLSQGKPTRRPAVAGWVIPRAASRDSIDSDPRALRVSPRTLAVVSLPVQVAAPLADIAVEIVQSESIWWIGADCGCPLKGGPCRWSSQLVVAVKVRLDQA